MTMTKDKFNAAVTSYYGFGVPGLIAAECFSVAELLTEKNRKYGNAALEPKRIFSRMDSIEQIKVRIDDKLSRIANTGLASADEDTVFDLIGYLILLRIALRLSD